MFKLTPYSLPSKEKNNGLFRFKFGPVIWDLAAPQEREMHYAPDRAVVHFSFFQKGHILYY